ncbi:LysR family transcriptional regulator [Patulibacter sp.]|uniref:LysR family transcriptional regulator n=1 Tax=Patulibacter sp. TaxID=1912859 RepID=UPI00271A93DD|nr:LysR family transcriptional regulator [Patulibacter sp.]MDO9409463.1 LysR family transcriptional regulator [Patulibacter sp.]
MDLLQLRVLREVARCGSISAAAEALDYTQPAVSRQLAALERTAGRPLVERTARGTRLTRVGEVLLRRADTILAELEAARSDLDRLEEDDRRPVRLTAFATAIATFVPDAVAVVRRALPDVTVEVRLSGDTRMGASDLRADRLDVALVNTDGRATPPAREHLVRRDPFWCCLPVGHRLADRDVVPFAALRDEPFLLTADTLCAERAIILEACATAGFRPRVTGHCDDPAVTQGLVASGVGVAVVPEMALLRLRDDVVLRPLAVPLSRRVVALVPHEAPPRPGRDELVAALREAGASWRSPVTPSSRSAAHARATLRA